MKIRKIARLVRPFYNLNNVQLELIKEFLDLYKNGEFEKYYYYGMMCLDFEIWIDREKRDFLNYTRTMREMIAHDSKWFVLSEKTRPFGFDKGFRNVNRMDWIVETLEEIAYFENKQPNPTFSHF